ncbi:hypothetical protein SAMN02745157_2284 [Kaistia soli DSM 19436]|uniref:DUF2125 domain-containing protein n=1 Tax=Kaistia soli DSM 19436 TaxID=1122133 RepID=A0A1M5CB23_9HYPH|nr:DUF2125 domain-containing protein [Kaistia soli]SHF51919.1 hypothetical protein SAMN02745157_2284 [Kaistia soli DSM 19436]
MSSATDTRPAPTRPGRGRRRFQILLVFIIAIALLWTAGWFGLRHYVSGKLDALEARAGAEGAVLTCGNRSIGGFPFRFDVTCMPIAAACPAEAVSLDIAGIEAIGMAYNPNRAIFAAKGPLALKAPGGASVDANWTSLQSSIRMGFSGLSRYSLVTDGFDATLADPSRLAAPIPLRAQHGEFHVLPDQAGADMLDVFLSLDQFTAFIPGRPVLPPVDTDMAVAVPTSVVMAHGDRAAAWIASGEPIRIDQLDTTIGGVASSITGELTPATDGLLNGRLTVRLDQLDRLPDLLETLKPGSGAKARQMIGLVSALLRPVTVDGKTWREATVTVASGRAMLGFIPLGVLPRIGPEPVVQPPVSALPLPLPDTSTAEEPAAPAPSAPAASANPSAAIAPGGESAGKPLNPQPNAATRSPIKRCAIAS